jgi:hypothetical protein
MGKKNSETQGTNCQSLPKINGFGGFSPQNAAKQVVPNNRP